MANPDAYTFRARRDEDHQGWFGLCAEVPEATWWANSESEALEGIKLLIKYDIFGTRESLDTNAP